MFSHEKEKSISFVCEFFYSPMLEWYKKLSLFAYRTSQNNSDISAAILLE